MAQNENSPAVGTGTKAGGAVPDERATDSRAARAVEDDQLESVRTTGAAPTGALTGHGAASPEAGASEQQPGEPPATRHDYKEQPRGDLKRNQSGIGSRLNG